MTSISSVAQRQDFVRGYLLVLISAICFGLQPFFAYFAYNDGASPIGLLLARFTLAACVLLLWLKAKGIALPRPRIFMQSSLIGVGYAGAALGYYSASHSTSISLAVILMFSFPAFVTLYSILVLRESATRTHIVSMLLAITGVVLATGINLEGDLQGILWALFAALSYGSAIIYGSHTAKPENPIASSWVILLAGVITFSCASLFQGATLPQSSEGWIAALGLAIFATIAPIATFISGSPLIGASSASTLSTLEPVVAILIAVSLIGEELSVMTIVGGVFVLIAAILLTRSGTR
ncbi:DMT family transporter [Oceanospirillum sediminis]|uniref:EamA family transporter n=1 Tax=Oceanospirillum sediminis TaxID=2760088 RepID=A0A839IQ57_9GAMM|nr:DMT family transporter [Oceanospirillum sediminis]MBB1486804.1 EamA family transporter [Oceanospirillum sediminis]